MTTTAPKLPFEEAKTLRDDMKADEQKSTDNLSTTFRSIAIGLALITYTFFTEDKGGKFLTDNFFSLLLASAFGVMALMADALQYLCAILQVWLMRRRIESHLAGQGTLTTDEVQKFKTNAFYWLRWLMFWGKLALVVSGAIVIIAIILRSAATIASSTHI